MAKQRRQAGCDVPHLMHELDRDPERRDWTKLPRDLAAEIAGRLLVIDLTEHIRFRSVCKPWRQSTEDPRGLHSRFIPRNWVVLADYLDCSRRNDGRDRKYRLLNVATGASITHAEFPELAGHYAVGYAEGLLVLWSNTDSGIRLLNPITHAVTDLPAFVPDLSVLAEAASMAVNHSPYRFRGFGVIDDDGGAGATGASAPTAVVMFLDGVVPMIACIRPGEPRWTLLDTSELDGGTASVSFSSALSLRGQFYMTTFTGDVLAVVLHPKPRLVYVIRQTTDAAAARLPATTLPAGLAMMRPFSSEFFLAPSGNEEHAEMLMVRASRDRRQVEVFEVDVDAGKLVPTSTVGADRAVFIGSSRALSISTRLFPSVAANAVYFCIGSSTELLFYIVHLDNGQGEPGHAPYSDQRQPGGLLVDPCNLDVYLASCVDAVQFLSM